MPELPEVETVVRVIRPHLLGRTILSSHFSIPRQLLPQTPREISRRVKNKRIEKVRRRGKFILIDLGNGTLLVHLRMTGRLYVRPKSLPADRHERASFDLDNNQVLGFRDPRTLGVIRWYKTEEPLDCVGELGWEPLNDHVSAAMLKEKLARRAMAIKPVLLDQTLYAGIGNIYASEALWDAGIHPAKSANRLKLAECERLVRIIPEVLQRALDQGGSTLRDFASPDGTPGSYQREFRVYGRKDEPCLRCGTPLHRIVQAQRSTYFCPKCQKK